MKKSKLWSLTIALLTASLSLPADTLKLNDGTSIEGELQKIHDGKVYFKTGFAGVIEVSKDLVVSLESADAISLRTESGEVFQGPVSSDGPGTVVVESPTGTVRTGMGEVLSGWQAGDEDPYIVSQMRHWSFQAGADVSGASGNSENFGASLMFDAMLEGPTDRLLFYGRYKYKETDGVRSEDEQKGGVRYTNFFTERIGWFVRQELERDTFEGIDFRSTTAAGLTRKLITEERLTLEGSAGLSYRYESYIDPLAEDEGFPGLDFGLNLMWQFADWGRLQSRLSYIPSVNDFADYLVEHESSVNIPLGESDFWVMRFGLKNQYNSNPGEGREKMDTTYFAGLMLSWE